LIVGHDLPDDHRRRHVVAANRSRVSHRHAAGRRKPDAPRLAVVQAIQSAAVSAEPEIAATILVNDPHVRL
jgi:hypothetical protein